VSVASGWLVISSGTATDRRRGLPNTKTNSASGITPKKIRIANPLPMLLVVIAIIKIT
jgi:hypothetical protein